MSKKPYTQEEIAKTKADLLAVYERNGGKLPIGVQRCTECPFFGTSMGSMLSKLFNPDDPTDHRQRGNCYAPVPNVGGGVLLRKAMPVEDARTLPTWCPLRLGDVVVTVGD